MKKIVSILIGCFLLISASTVAQSGESPINFELPEAATIGVAVPFSGVSVMYKEFKFVKVTVTGPKNYSKEIKENLNKEGKFNNYWVAPLEVGTYTFIAYSSDGKAQETKNINISGIDFLDKIAEETLPTISKMEAIVEGKAKDIQSKITTADKKVLEEKMAKFKADLQRYKNCYTSLIDASKKAKALLKPGQPIPQKIAFQISELQQTIKKNEDDLKRVNEYYSHTPNKYSICDYLNAFKEVLAAYSTITGFAVKSVSAIVKGITINTVIPAAATKAYEMANAVKGRNVGDEEKAVTGQFAKMYVTPAAEFGSIDVFMGKVGLATDILGFVVNILIKTYCITLTNKITQENKFTFTNEYNEKWYIYKSKLEGVLSLRAEKAAAAKDNIIKMKGSIEGNLTSFKAFADPKACIAKELKSSGNYNNTICFPLVEINPVTIPFSTAANDVAGFGFGSRMLATPACFNIQVDAEFNQQTKEIKLFVNKENAVDFTPAVKFRQLFMYIAVLPITQYQDYPIEKAAITMFANFKEKNIFKIIEKGKGDKTYSGNVKRTVTGDGFVIDLSATIDPE